MDIDILKRKIEEFVKSEYKPQIFIVTKSSTKKCSLFEFNADADFLNTLYKMYKENLSNTLVDKTINDYDLEHTEDDSIEEVSSSEVKEFDVIKNLMNSKPQNICSDKDFKIKNISLLVVNLYLENEKLTIFSRYKGGKSLLKSTKAFIGGEKLEKFEKDLLYFIGNVDAFELGNKIYICNRFNFNIIFSIRDVYYKVIEENKEKIIKYDIFDNAKSSDIISIILT